MTPLQSGFEPPALVLSATIELRIVSALAVRSTPPAPNSLAVLPATVTNSRSMAPVNALTPPAVPFPVEVVLPLTVVLVTVAVVAVPMAVRPPPRKTAELPTMAVSRIVQVLP